MHTVNGGVQGAGAEHPLSSAQARRFVYFNISAFYSEQWEVLY